jgi:superoxide dismutase, Fe-Mn family
MTVRYVLPDMPYDYAALEPAITGEILELHHSKHHAAYVKGANDTLDRLAETRDAGDFSGLVGLEKTFAFNLSGHVLHTIFWENLSPEGGDRPEGELAAAIDEHFGSFDAFSKQLSSATATVQGSGWGVLAWEPLSQRLVVEQVYDHHGNVGIEHHPAPGVRCLGTRLLPAVPQRAPGLRAQAVVTGQLDRRHPPLRRRPRRRHRHHRTGQVTTAVKVERLGPDGLRELAGSLCEVYERCFTEPPWHEPADQIAGYATVLAGHLGQPGMSALVVRAGEGVAGVVYGWPAPAAIPQDPFHDALAAQVPADVHRDLVAPAVVVVELMVHPDHRGCGIGRTLLDRYVKEQPAAWLCTHPDAPAAALYESAGWRRRGSFTNQYGDPRVVYTT